LIGGLGQLSDDFDDSSEDDESDERIGSSVVGRDPSVTLDPKLFCGTIKSFKQGCAQENLLDLWKYEPKKVVKLNLPQVLWTLNSTKASPVTGQSVDYVHLLSGITRNQSGFITAAKAMMLNWLVSVNISKLSNTDDALLAGADDWVISL
jgi:hypothetical protein